MLLHVSLMFFFAKSGLKIKTKFEDQPYHEKNLPPSKNRELLWNSLVPYILHLNVCVPSSKGVLQVRKRDANYLYRTFSSGLSGRCPG